MARDYLTLAQNMAQEIVFTRREFHQYPEAMHQEVQTNRRIRAFLDKHGIGYMAPADNITVAVLPGATPGRMAGIRCDTDALEVQEQTGLPYQSKNPGMMHACGHDGHITMGLYAALLLHQHRAQRAGTVKIIFQPAEEGGKGALQVLDTGAAHDLDAIFGLHVWPTLPVGKIQLSSGPVCASTDRIVIEVLVPEATVHPERSADALVVVLRWSRSQHVVSRLFQPWSPACCRCAVSMRQPLEHYSWCRAAGRHAAHLLETVREEALTRMQEVIKATAQAHRCRATLTVHPVCGPIMNDADLTEHARKSAITVFGVDHVQPQAPSMIGDDFAEFTATAPGCYAFLGIASPDGSMGNLPLHHNQFTLDENALPLGAAWLAQAADDYARNIAIA